MAASKRSLPDEGVIFIAPQRVEKKLAHYLKQYRYKYFSKYAAPLLACAFCLTLLFLSTNYSEGKEKQLEYTATLSATQPDESFAQLLPLTPTPEPEITEDPRQSQLISSSPHQNPTPLAPLPSPSDKVQQPSTLFDPPLASYTSVSTYFSAFHPGVDLTDPAGTPVRAVNDGFVSSAGWSSEGYGNLITLSHSSGIVTLYAHLAEIDVKANTSVKKDQVIGLVGCTGHCTGNHLHFEMHVNGVAVNPFLYL